MHQWLHGPVTAVAQSLKGKGKMKKRSSGDGPPNKKLKKAVEVEPIVESSKPSRITEKVSEAQLRSESAGHSGSEAVIGPTTSGVGASREL